MNSADFETLNELKQYFSENCKNLVFSNEMTLDDEIRAKMYYVKADEITEKNNYKKIFQEYLILYARSYEKLRYFEQKHDDLSVDLIEYGKNTWEKGGLIITTNLESAGIFGELFNDFYLNIVKNENILLTYSSRRGASEKNVKGVDVVGCTCEDRNLTLIYSESKFLGSASAAQIALRSDINGTDDEAAHISREYINKFTIFLLDKNHSLYNDSDENTEIIINKIDSINAQIYNGREPIEVFNELGVKIRFVFFAIYTDNMFTPKQREKFYRYILADFHSQISKTGIDNYDIEIVFIPIVNNSMVIKEYMSKWD